MIVGGTVDNVISAVCRRHGLSHAALNALAVIEGEGKPMLTGEVAARMHVTSGTVTSLLDNLERKKYVSRGNDPDDRRRVLVDITPAAQAVLDEALPEVQQVVQLLFERVGVQRQQQLLDALDDIHRAAEEIPDTLPPAEPRRRPKRLTR